MDFPYGFPCSLWKKVDHLLMNLLFWNYSQGGACGACTKAFLREDQCSADADRVWRTHLSASSLSFSSSPLQQAHHKRLSYWFLAKAVLSLKCKLFKCPKRGFPNYECPKDSIFGYKEKLAEEQMRSFGTHACSLAYQQRPCDSHWRGCMELWIRAQLRRCSMDCTHLMTTCVVQQKPLFTIDLQPPFNKFSIFLMKSLIFPTQGKKCFPKEIC